METIPSQSGVIIAAALFVSLMVGLVTSGGTGVVQGWLLDFFAPPASIAAVSDEQPTLLPPPSPTPRATPTAEPSATPTPVVPVIAPSATPRPTEESRPTETALPEPTATASAVSSNVTLVIVVQGRLNVRVAPSTAADVLFSLPQGTEVAVVGRDAASGWAQIQVPGEATTGWVTASATFVTIQGDLSALPVTSGGG